ncbi:hypothetical protein [Wolbachia endosymbiont (group E) of Neria commutata]|uniref:hypothetical protein n=1 Tax=Wolbachia endosymbiont (group E) of Neria commutata TaxID=3066149 RepID=UPI00313350F9
MTKTNYTYKKGDAPWISAKSGWDQTAGDSWRVTGGASGLGQWIDNNRWKTATLVGVLSLVALTSAYFLSPAYAAFVGTAVVKAAALVSPVVTAVSAFLVAHPLIATFAIIAAVVTVGVLAYMNNDKANKIDEVSREKGVLAYKIEEAGSLLNGNSPESKINELKNVLGFSPAPAKTTN